MSSDNKSSGVTYLGCMGCAIATVLSWTTWHSIWWCLLHSFLGWIYVIYYGIIYLA